MRKVFILFLMMFLGTGHLAMAEGDLWDNFGDQNSYGQKPVTDKEFNDTIDRLKGKRQKSKTKEMKGESYHQGSETQFVNELPKELPVLLVPVGLQVTSDAVLPIGHYQVVGEKKDGIPHLKFYQSQYLIADLPATETKDDYNQSEIYFVRLLSQNEKQVKIIFGSIDFNAYKILNIVE